MTCEKQVSRGLLQSKKEYEQVIATWSMTGNSKKTNGIAGGIFTPERHTPAELQTAKVELHHTQQHDGYP